MNSAERCFTSLITYFISHLSKYSNCSFLVSGTLMFSPLREIWASRIIQSNDSRCRGLKLTSSHDPQICVPQLSPLCVCWISQKNSRKPSRRINLSAFLWQLIEFPLSGSSPTFVIFSENNAVESNLFLHLRQTFDFHVHCSLLG